MALKAFLKIAGIDGESPDAGHEDWIEVTSFAHGASQNGTFGRDGRMANASANVAVFSVTKDVDKASPLIAEYCCAGKKLDSVKLEVCAATDGGMKKFMTYEMSPCIVSAVNYGGSGGGEDRPAETVSFRFQTIKWEFIPYKEHKPQSPVRGGWDANKNQTAS